MPRNTRRPLNECRLQRRVPQIDVLEQRLLFSLTAITESIAQLAADDEMPPIVHHAPLSARESGGDQDAPVFSGFPPVILGEDDNDYYLDLTTVFQNANGGTTGLQFQLLGNDNPQLFDIVSIVGTRLRLDLSRHAFGDAALRIRATDAAMQFVDATLPVTVLPVNDRPTTTGFSNRVLAHGQSRVEIDLFAAFSDLEDTDQQLIYTITEVTRPELFSSISIDTLRGLLLMNVKPGVAGSSSLTLRATDSEGAYVEMTSGGRNFAIYDGVEGELPIVDSLNLQDINIVTSWWLFEHDNGTYVYDHIDEQQFRNYLNSAYFDPSRPTVFNIENDFFENTPSGRELRAEVMRIFWDESPNANQAGFYRYLPARDWRASVNWRRAQDDVERGLFTGYASDYEVLRQVNQDWQLNNLLWRTAPLADGSVVSDYISAVYPSLYTFYRHDYATTSGPVIVDVGYDGQSGLFWLDGVHVADGMEVRFNASHLDKLPDGFRTYTPYYVVNAQGSTFQLSATPNGLPLPLDPRSAGSHFLEIIGPRNYVGHDPDVIFWRYYAEENIAEARKFNVPVTVYLSPSFRGVGTDFLDENFFRLQLDTAFELADSIMIYDPGHTALAASNNLGWYRALSDFQAYLRHPTQFQITVDTSNLPDDDSLLRGVNGPRLDRFSGIAFAAATRRESDYGNNRPPTPDPPPTEAGDHFVRAFLPISKWEMPQYAGWNSSRTPHTPDTGSSRREQPFTSGEEQLIEQLNELLSENLVTVVKELISDNDDLAGQSLLQLHRPGDGRIGIDEEVEGDDSADDAVDFEERDDVVPTTLTGQNLTASMDSSMDYLTRESTRRGVRRGFWSR
jgi:hypothetical protein